MQRTTMKNDARSGRQERKTAFTRLRPYLLSALATVLVVEIVLRLVRPEAMTFSQSSRELVQSHPVWKVDYRPNARAHFYLRSWSGMTLYDFSVHTNEYGFRIGSRQLDEKVVPDKSKRFIHAIGDSFTQGWGVNYEATYPAILDDLFDGSTQVLNLGLNGFGAIAATEKSMQLWDTFPARYAVFLTTVNDFSDDQSAIQRSALVKTYVVPAVDFARRYWYTANFPFFLKLLDAWSAPLALTDEMTRKGKWLSPRLDHTLVEMTGQDYAIMGGKPRLDPVFVQPSLDALGKYAAFVQSRGAKLLVVALEDEERSVHIENETMREYCVRNNIPFKRFAMTDALKMNSEGHLNALGNRRLAEKVHAWIAEQEQIDTRPAAPGYSAEAEIPPTR
jgi:lysophospholipase L1-like esterase